MDILKAFDVLGHLESRVQALYDYYNKLFIDDREAAGMFYTLALDEKYQCDIVAYQTRMVRRNRNLFKDVEIDVSAVDSVLSRIESILKSPTPPTLDEAVAFTLDLKVNSLEYHYTNLIAKSNPEVAPLISALASSDKEHTLMLSNLAGKRGVPLPASWGSGGSAEPAAKPADTPEQEKTAELAKAAGIKPYKLKLMEQLIEANNLTAALYETFERRFPEHAGLWSTLAREKHEHCCLLKDLKGGALAGEAFFEEGKTTTYTVTSLIEYINGIRERAQRDEIDLNKAVSLSLDIMKSGFIKDPAKLFVSVSPELKGKVVKLQLQSDEHTAKLKELQKRL